MVLVRSAQVEDAAAWATVAQAASPSLVIDTASAAHELRIPGPAAPLGFLAEEVGTVAGVTRQRGHGDQEQAELLVMVHPARRRQGVGTALVRRYEQHLRDRHARCATTIVEDDPGSRSAAHRWGFVVTRPLRTYRGRGLAGLGPPAPAPPATELVPVREAALAVRTFERQPTR